MLFFLKWHVCISSVFPFLYSVASHILVKSSDVFSSSPSSLKRYFKMMPAISTKDYAVGDLICSEMPFLKVLDRGAKSKYCDNCLCQSNTVSLKKCTSCMNMHYCSKSCQKKDWMAGHKYECKFYKHHYFDLKHNDLRLFLRLYLLLKNQKDLASRKVILQYDESMEKSFDDLNKFNGEISKLSPNLTSLYHFILKTFEDCGIGNIDRSILFEYFCTYFCNLLPVFLKYDLVAYGIFMSRSVFGHSCAPNATRSCNGCRSDVRAIKEIKKGDPITISISRMDISRQERRSYQEGMLIDCTCERCSSNFDREFDYENMKQMEIELNRLEHYTKQWDKAFQLGKKLIPMFKHLGGYDITVSWHLMRMAELYKKTPIVELDSVVGDVLEDTVKHVKVTHGVDHPLYKEYLQLLEEYQEA